jgi:hypothetical protein
MREGRRWVTPKQDALKQELSHGYCPACLEEAHKQIQALRYAVRHLPLAANP